MLLLIRLLIKSIVLSALYRKNDLIISTNPKWLLLIPYISRRKFDLYLGDPFLGDITREDSLFYSYLWKKSQKLIKKLIVFSPFLYERLKQEMGHDRVQFLMREPIQNLPQMIGEGLLYLGDFHSIDRNIEPLISALKEKGVRLDLYGNGDEEIVSKNVTNLKVFKRKPLHDLYNIFPNYKILVIILNKSGLQVPGKLYDFLKAPFNVLILYEDYLDIKFLPQPNHYFYCKNIASEITILLDELL